jgi:hypothetical protein
LGGSCKRKLAQAFFGVKLNFILCKYNKTLGELGWGIEKEM